ncbi:MAG: DUF6542 domain-containing protein, partial [Mycobacterium sp.]
ERSGRPRRQGEPPIDPGRQPRRPREPRDPREPRRTPPPSRGTYDAGDPYERPRRRPRPEGYDGFSAEYGGRPDDRLEPYPDRPRRSSSDSSHHPVSRVRYRSTDEERHTEHRTRPRNTHRRDEQY